MVAMCGLAYTAFLRTDLYNSRRHTPVPTFLNHKFKH